MKVASADLVIVIRTRNGKIVQPTIGGLPTNDRPVIVQPTENGIPLGGKKGQPPDETQPRRKRLLRGQKRKSGRPRTHSLSTKVRSRIRLTVLLCGALLARKRYVLRTCRQSQNFARRRRSGKAVKPEALAPSFRPPNRVSSAKIHRGTTRFHALTCQQPRQRLQSFHTQHTAVLL
jgi:hypothetical protein